MSKKEAFTYKKDFNNKFAISNPALQRILQFYLFECPVPGTSVRGKTFEEYGIKGSPAFSALKKKMLDASEGQLRENYKPCKKDELPIALNEVAFVVPPNEYCVFLSNEEKTTMQ